MIGSHPLTPHAQFTRFKHAAALRETLLWHRVQPDLASGVREARFSVRVCSLGDLAPARREALCRTAQGKNAKKPLGSPALERW